MNENQSSGPVPDSPMRAAQHDLLASIVVFLVSLPLCMGVAIASGVPIALGLFTGIIAGIVVGSLAGCPLQVSGPAAGLAVIVYDIVQRFGLEQLGIIVLIAGLAQAVAGTLRLGQWFRAVSPAVIEGMLAGIGVLIFVSQIHVMLDAKPTGSAIRDITTIPQSISKVFTRHGFGSRETRIFRSEHLRLVGKLRREQAAINEQVMDLLPGSEDAEELTGAVTELLSAKPKELEELAKHQRAIAKTLGEINGIVRDFESQSGAIRSQQIIAALEATDEKMDQVVEDLEARNLLKAAESQSAVDEAFENYLASLKNHVLAAQFGLLTIGLIVVWPLLVPKRLKAIPAPLIAVVTVTAIAFALRSPLVYVDVPVSLTSQIRMPDVGVLFSSAVFALLPAGLALAAVASAETLLCATATDQMHTGPRTKYNQELFAQGIGNICCGMIGALPMTGVIVRSTANIQAGGTTRLSAIMHGVWLWLFIVVMTPVLSLVPTSVLAAILVYTGYRLMNPSAVKELKKFGWSEVAIFALTVLTIVFVNLLFGIVFGFVLATIKLLHRLSRLKVKVETTSESQTTMTLSGAATFLALPKLASALEAIPAGTNLRVRFHDLGYIDHACLDHLQRWSEQHESTDGHVEINWDSLASKYHKPTVA